MAKVARPLTKNQAKVVDFLKEPGRIWYAAERQRSVMSMLEKGIVVPAPERFMAVYRQCRARIFAGFAITAIESEDYLRAMNCCEDASRWEEDEDGYLWLCLPELRDQYTAELAVTAARCHHEADGGYRPTDPRSPSFG